MPLIKRLSINIISILIIGVLCVASITKIASATGYDEKFFSANDILFYNPNDGGCATLGTGTSNLVGSDNEEKAIRYLIGKGLSLAQASGVIGNLQQESRGINPLGTQDGTIVDDNYVLPNNSVGFGIAQWTSSGRQQGLSNLAKSSNRKITDLSLQLDYLWQEFNSGSYKSALEKLKTIDDPVEAAIVFHDGFEQSGDSANKVKNVRGGFATDAYNRFKTLVPDAQNNIPTGNINCTGDGKASGFIDGFTIYTQYDPQWGNLPLNASNFDGTTTIGKFGCGPSSIAMIITNLAGHAITPVQTSALAVEYGAYIQGKGTDYHILRILDDYGLKSNSIDNPSVPAVNAVLSAGGLVLAAGNGPLPYYQAGHWIVIRGVTADGKYKIGDSAGHSDTDWPAENILIDGVSLWAVTK